MCEVNKTILEAFICEFNLYNALFNFLKPHGLGPLQFTDNSKAGALWFSGETNSASQFEELNNTNIIRVHCLVSRKQDLSIYIFLLNLKKKCSIFGIDI